jgi:hypothetical protein
LPLYKCPGSKVISLQWQGTLNGVPERQQP